MVFQSPAKSGCVAESIRVAGVACWLVGASFACMCVAFPVDTVAESQESDATQAAEASKTPTPSRDVQTTIQGSEANATGESHQVSASTQRTRTAPGGGGANRNASRSQTAPGQTGSWASWARELWRGEADASDTSADSASGAVLTAEAYVEDGRWRRAMRLLERGDCKKALDLVDTVIDQSAENLNKIRGVRYAVARIKMCTPGYKKRGRTTMREIAAGGDVVAELARRRLGLGRSPVSAYGENEDGQSAESQLPSYVLEESNSSKPRSQPTTNEIIREARGFARNGEVDKAVDRLQTHRANVADDWSRYRTYEVQAEILWRAGERKAAARAYRGAYRLGRAWSRGGDLEDRIERLETQSNLEILRLGSRIDRMRELIDRGEYHDAKQVSIHNADLAGVKGREIEGWGLYRRGLEAEQVRDRDRAIELFEKAEARVESDVIRPRLYYGWARALRRVGKDPEAVELYGRLCREYPQHHLCDDAQFQAGRLSMYDNHFAQARALFADVVGLHPESPHHASALWLGGFSAYLAGDYDSVHRPLQVLRERYGDRFDSSGTSLALKARYWQAVAALKMGQQEKAERKLQNVINDNPLSWYGRLAAARLEQIGVAPVVPVPPTELSPGELTNLGSLGLPDHPKYQVAKEYAKIGLYGDAAEDIKRQLEVEPSPPGARHLLATLWLLSGDIHRSHWMMNDYVSPRGPTIFDLRTWGLAYPVEYLKQAHHWGREYNVDPLLIQSVIRQESGFRAKVDSYAGAVGLMQLMPGTANYASNEWFDGSWVSRADLRTPDINVRYGTVYLRVLTGHTKGNMAMALAGYNAGPGSMRRWFQDYGDREVDAWVESLTYEQARGYVRKVYTNYVRYTALYAGGSRELPTPSLTLPKELAPWGDVPELQTENKKIGLLFSPPPT